MATRGLLIAALALVWAAPAMAIDFNGYASLGTDYVYRGISLLESGPGVQGGIEAHAGPYFLAGVSAAKIDRQWGYHVDESDHVQFDTYAGADFGCGPHCRARVVYSRYIYPGPDDRNWSETTAALALFDRAGISYSYSPRGLGTYWPTRTWESWLQQPLSRAATIEVGYGRVLVLGFDYWYAHVGASYRINRFVVDLTEYVGDDSLEHLMPGRNVNRLVLTLSTGF